MTSIGALQKAWSTDASVFSDVSFASTDDDLVAESPASLASSARARFPLAVSDAVYLDIYSTARILRSEGYGGDPDVGRAACHVVMAYCAKNRAGRLGQSVTQMVTYATNAAGRGHYGRQDSSWAGTRYCSTYQDPRKWEMMVAASVILGEVGDLGLGATSFLDPAVFAVGRQGDQALRPFDNIMEEWHGFVPGKGNTLAWPGPIPSVDSAFFLHFRKEGSRSIRAASLDRCKAVFRDYLAGKHGAAPGDPDSVFRGFSGMVSLVGLGIKKGLFL